jgi:hypothetical protein
MQFIVCHAAKEDGKRHGGIVRYNIGGDPWLRGDTAAALQSDLDSILKAWAGMAGKIMTGAPSRVIGFDVVPVSTDFVIIPFDDNGVELEFVPGEEDKQAQKDASKLIQSNPVINEAVAQMVHARRFFRIAFNELILAMDKAEIPAVDGPAAVGEIITHRSPHKDTARVLHDYAATLANEDFNKNDLLAGLVGFADKTDKSRSMIGTIHWLKKVIEADIRADKASKTQESLELENKRKANKVPIGITTIPGGTADLTRGTSVVLVGYAPAVNYLLKTAIDTALTASDDSLPTRTYAVVHFVSADVCPPGDNPNYVRIGRRHWQQSFSRKADMQNLEAVIIPQLKRRPDLVVVDDLAVGSRDALVIAGEAKGGVAPWRVADAHKQIFAWCQKAGAALLSGVPAGKDEPVNCGGKGWESLRPFAVVCPVMLDRVAEKTFIRVGLDAQRIEVAPELLTPVSQIIGA